jgi:hypothetical protein
MNRTNLSDWVEAKLAEGQAFNRISEARSQADWVKAWRTWTLTIQGLRQLARHPASATEPESEVELKSEQAA